MGMVGKGVEILIPSSLKEDFIAIVRANVTFPITALEWAHILFSDHIKLDKETQGFLKTVKSSFWHTVINAVQEHGTNFKEVAQVLHLKLNIKGKALFHPLRLALTGRIDGPEMGKIFMF